MKRFIILFLASTLCCACENFLESRSKSSILEDDLFATREGVEEAIYGLYNSLAAGGMYTSDIPLTIDILGQYYNFPGQSLDNNDLKRHEHQNDGPRKTYLGIWGGCYKFISDLNKVVEQLEQKSDAELRYRNLYMGEVLGLRAFVHFDLLRMFGHVGLEERGIPYVTRYGMYVTPFHTTGECYNKIIAELKAADSLLKQDQHLLVHPRAEEDRYNLFLSDREFHFNQYAAKALLARVYWTRNQPNDLDSAAMYAREVVESGKFPLPDESRRDYNYFSYMVAGVVEANEGIFGLYQTATYNTFSTNFVNVKTGGTPNYYPANYNLLVAENGENNYRSYWIRIPKIPNVTTTASVYMKLIDENEFGGSKSGAGISGVNLIRVPEMYLILAEALLESDPVQAQLYFNDFLVSRGLNPKEVTLDLIDSEFQKEYVQEGQWWFRMKRRQVEKVGSIEMTPEKWFFPLPDEELEYRPEGSY